MPRTRPGSLRSAGAVEGLFFAGILAAVGLYLLLGGLGAATDWWWVDESYTWDMIQRPAAEIGHRAAADVHPPLYYWALAGWHHVLPQPRAMRAFSLLMGLGALLAAGAAGRLLRGRRMGVLTALLWATCPLFLHQSQDARMYAMGLCLETVALAGWALAPWRPRLGWIVFVFALIASLYTHNHCLLFAGALIGCEMARCLLARRNAAGAGERRTAGTGWRWILSAALVIGLAYAPWTLVLRRQMNSTIVTALYHAPTWWDVFYKACYFPYALNFDLGFVPWIPGVLLLLVLPLAWCVWALWTGRSREALPEGNARPVAAVGVAALGAFLGIVLYSMWVRPMYEVSRHGVMLIPFFLFPAAACLEAFSRRRLTARLAVLALIALTGTLAYCALRQSRDTDVAVPRDALIDRAPTGLPIFFYPPVYGFHSLMWAPLAIYPCADGDSIPRGVTSCTLAVNYSVWPQREEINRQVRLLFSQCGAVRQIYSSDMMCAYVLNGVPAGALAGLLHRIPGWGEEAVARQVGRWVPSPVWQPEAFARMVQPAGEPVHLSAANPALTGLRLANSRNTLVLPAASLGPSSMGILTVGGYYVSNGGPVKISSQLDGGSSETCEVEARDFMISRLIRVADGRRKLTLDIPEALARRPFAPAGEAPAGVYLTWVGTRALEPRDFQQTGLAGEFIDAGALGDEIFFKSGLNQPEGLPPSEVRWTKGSFDMEAPVFAGQEVREVALRGMLPAAARNRTIVLEAQPLSGAPSTHAWRNFEKSDYGDYVISLPHPLTAAGVYRFKFKMDPWSTGTPGGDPRWLGFFLDGVGLRPAATPP